MAQARRTQSASSRSKEASKNTPDNLVEADNVQDEREQQLKDAEKHSAAAKAAAKNIKADHPEQAYKSSHVPGDPGQDGHPGYFPDQYTKDRVVYGHFCVVTGGDEEGVYGVYIDNVASDDKGTPTQVLVRERNTGRILTVNYDDLAPAQGGDVGRGR